MLFSSYKSDKFSWRLGSDVAESCVFNWKYSIFRKYSKIEFGCSSRESSKKPMELYMFLECGVSVLGSQFSEMCTFLARKCTCSYKQLKCIGNYNLFRQRSWHPGIHSVFRALAPTSVRQIWKILYFSVRN